MCGGLSTIGTMTKSHRAGFEAMLISSYKAQHSTVKRVVGCVLLGLFFVIIAVLRSVELGPVLLLLTGAWSIYGGIASLFVPPQLRNRLSLAEFVT
jgi:hypothetical protein